MLVLPDEVVCTGLCTHLINDSGVNIYLHEPGNTLGSPCKYCTVGVYCHTVAEVGVALIYSDGVAAQNISLVAVSACLVGDLPSLIIRSHVVGTRQITFAPFTAASLQISG